MSLTRYVIVYSGTDVPGVMNAASTVLKKYHINIESVSMSSGKDKHSTFIACSANAVTEEENSKRLRRTLEVELTKALEKRHNEYSRENHKPQTASVQVEVSQNTDEDKARIYVDFVIANKPGYVAKCTKWLLDDGYNLDEMFVQPWLPKEEERKEGEILVDKLLINYPQDRDEEKKFACGLQWYCTDSINGQSVVAAEKSRTRILLTISKIEQDNDADFKKAFINLQNIVKKLVELGNPPNYDSALPKTDTASPEIDTNFNVRIRSIKWLIVKKDKLYEILGSLHELEDEIIPKERKRLEQILEEQGLEALKDALRKR